MARDYGFAVLIPAGRHKEPPAARAGVALLAPLNQVAMEKSQPRTRVMVLNIPLGGLGGSTWDGYNSPGGRGGLKRSR